MFVVNSFLLTTVNRDGIRNVEIVLLLDGTSHIGSMEPDASIGRAIRRIIREKRLGSVRVTRYLGRSDRTEDQTIRRFTFEVSRY